MTDPRMGRARARLEELCRDRFWSQVLRELVPPGGRVMAALADETVHDVVNRAVRVDGPTLPLLAVFAPGREDGEPTLVQLRRHDDGTFGFGRPGDWRAVDRGLSQESTLGEVIAAFTTPDR